MKTKFLITIIFITVFATSHQLKSQNSVASLLSPSPELYKSQLTRVFINEHVSLHFISPESIGFVDISTNNLVGDIPVENIVRLKLSDVEALGNDHSERSMGIVTVIGEKYIAQYDIWYSNDDGSIATQIEITEANTNSLDVAGSPLSENDLRFFSLKALKHKPSSHATRSVKYGLTGQVNNIFTVDDYIFLDISYQNKTNLKVDLDHIRFKIDDKRITKATNVQSIEITPSYKLYNKSSFKKNHRNIFVLKKFTYPDNKVLSIELAEDQISGRTLLLQLDYSDLLNADTL